LKNPAASAVTNLTGVGGDRTFAANIQWSPSERAKEYYVSRSKVNGPCLTDWIGSYDTVRVNSFRSELSSLGENTAPGNYCFSVWAVNVDGYASGHATVVVNYQPPLPNPVTNFTATVTADEYYGSSIMTLAWTNPVGNVTNKFMRSDANGPCILDINDAAHETYPYSNLDPTGQFYTGQDYPPGAGTYCYTVFASDDYGKTYSTAVTVIVAFEG
jgi:hypothetical protein